jgi:hypothetical protein
MKKFKSGNSSAAAEAGKAWTKIKTSHHFENCENSEVYRVDNFLQ